jgi:hypothetical protein
MYSLYTCTMRVCLSARIFPSMSRSVQVAAGGTSALYSGAAASVAALLGSSNPDPILLAGMLPAALAAQQYLD